MAALLGLVSPTGTAMARQASGSKKMARLVNMMGYCIVPDGKMAMHAA
jgi:hypothetical protein